MIKIYDIYEKVILQVEVTSEAKREEEMSKSDFISLSFRLCDKIILPVGAYIEYTYKIDKVRSVTRRFSLLEPYEPTQVNETSWKYTPEFQHPKMLLSKIPFYILTNNSKGETIKQTSWAFNGSPLGIMDKVCKFLNKEIGFADKGWAKSVTTTVANTINVSFTDVDIISALTAISNAVGNNCEWHIDYDNEIIYLGNISIGEIPTILNVGDNVCAPSTSLNNEKYYNAFTVFGGSRNIVQVTNKGENVSASDIRLQLKPNVGTVILNGAQREYSIDDFSTIDFRQDKTKEALMTKVLTYADIYPSLYTYVYNVRSREKYVIDENGNKVVLERNTDGSVRKYKTFTVWYMRLAYPSKEKKDGLQVINQTIKDGVTYYWYDFIITDDLIVNGKTLSCSFEVNTNEGALTTPLAGRGSNGDYVGFELTYHKEDIRSHTSDDVDKSDFYINKGDYEIIYQEDNGFFVPTNRSEMIIPKGEAKPSFRCNITVLYNIAMSETEYYDDAQQRLFDKAMEEIKKYMEDLNNYTLKSYPHVFLQNNPCLQIGQSVTYQDTKGYTLKTRVLKLSTNIDYDCIQEITVGNKAIKGTITQIKEDIQTIIANGGNGGESLTGNQFSKLLAKYGTQYFLSKQYKDAAKEVIAFEKGLTTGAYKSGESGAAIDANGAAEVKSMAAREGVTVGDDVFVRADGGARLGDVEVARVRSKGADEGDRNLISGRGFDLFMGADGKSHLWVDDANIRGKLVAMSTEIRKVSYSGGTLLLSNAGSTLARVTAVTDDQGAVVAYKCWAKADDGTTQTMNWWRIGMMALCQTFNVSGNTGGNRRYWRLVVGVGQERLDDGKIYDYVLLSNIARFTAIAHKIPYYSSGSVLTAKSDVLRWAGEPVGMVQRKGNIPFLIAFALQEGSTADVSNIKDDDGVLLMNRGFYGYEPTADGGAPDAPMAGDVIVQCGDQVRWLSRGNVIRLCTSSDDGDIDTTPSLSMYHGIGRLREVIVNGEAKADKSVWQWRDLTALISPTKTYINSDYFYFFSEDNGGIEKAQSFSEFKMQSDKVAVSVRDVATGIEKAGVHLNGDDSCIVAKANKFYTENSAGVRTTSVDEEGNLIARSLHSVSKSESKVMYVDIEDGMLTFRTSQNNAMMQFGIDEHGFPSMVCYNPDGSIGCIYGPSGPNNNPLINPNAVLVMGEITGSYTYSKASFAGDKTMHTLSYTVKLTVKNNSGNYKTISNAVLKVKVASPYDAKTVELHSSDEKLLLNQETMDMTYTFVQSFSLPSSTIVSIADHATVTVVNEGGRQWTTEINKTN